MPDFNSLGFLLFILLIVYACTGVTQLFFHWFFYSRLAFYKKKKQVEKLKPVSVVICARNEYYNLEKNLPLILEQDYPDYEVILVNDASDDGSDELLKLLSQQYKHLKVINLNQNLNFFSGKKFPLSIGIKSATNDIILLTDADCRPAGKQWIRQMSANFTGHTEIVLGYGPYKERKGFLNSLIRYDTFQIGIQYLSLALSGNAYMGVGRNMAYAKSLFYSNKGFTSHYRVASGDDDLFINRAAIKGNTGIEIDPGTFTISDPHKNLAGWIKQKRRHLSTGKFYRGKYKFLLGLNISSLAIFYLLFIVLLIFTYQWFIVLALFTARLASYILIVKKSGEKLNEKKLLVFSPMYEVLLLVINLLVSFSNLFMRTNKWK